MWSYTEALEWLYARQNLGIKLGLGKVERLLAALGNPHHAYKVVHVAGTNGKGSVTLMLAQALQRAGYRVGATTSPHLVHFTERIELDGKPVSREAVADGLQRMRSHVEALDAEGNPPTFFEVVSALAFLLFRDAGAQWAVVETGMGGRLDATNVVAPEVCVITNVELDHMAHLGPDVGSIAFEKAGIMKPGVPCVTACNGTALQVLNARSHELQVPMSIVGRDYIVVPGRDGLALVRPNGEARYEVGLRGAHQHTNAALVVAAVDALRRRGHAIPERALIDALRLTRNPGRLDLVRVPGDDLVPGTPPRTVEVLVDGAHNPAAAQALRQYLFDEGWSGFHLVAGFCADKDWQATVDEWLLPCAHLWAVPVRSTRTLAPEGLAAFGRAAGVRSDVEADVASALRAAIKAGADRILVAGSLFLAGEALAHLNGASPEEIRGAQ